ncbi:hypothetical protein, partial [Bacillus cereus]|uniref:hypothetical protein n=1 Tax=Bacillus cereus TaxID=1396 RepID=UPI0021121C1E|nr:hypothetical protein [Bacillus cereus]
LTSNTIVTFQLKMSLMVSTGHHIAETYQQRFVHLKQNEYDSPLRQINIKKSYTQALLYISCVESIGGNKRRLRLYHSRIPTTE